MFSIGRDGDIHKFADLTSLVQKAQRWNFFYIYKEKYCIYVYSKDIKLREIQKKNNVTNEMPLWLK